MTDDRDEASPPAGSGPEPVPPSLATSAVRGAAVTVTAQIAKIVLQVVSVVLLARLLSPHDYGLIAMVVAIIGVAELLRDFGLSSAAIQAPTLSREEQTNLFWLNTLLGFVLALVAVAASPLLASLYGEPDVRPIAAALGVNFLLNGMASQFRADLNRRMKFRRLALADVAAPATGLVVALTLALLGTGYWALVAQQVTQAVVALILLAAGAGWLPRWYRRDVPVRRFLHFGVRLVGSQLVTYVGGNIDSVLLGLRVGAGPLGLYNRAFQLVMTPLAQIRTPLTNVAIPVLSRVQHEERRFRSFVLRGQIAMGYTIVVALGIVAGSAAPLVRVVLGEQWVGATDVLRLLAIGAGIQTLAFVNYWVYVTKGLVGHLLNYTFISTGIRVALVVTGSFFGLLGVAGAMAVAPAVAWPLSFWWLSRRASVPVRDLWLGGLRVTILTALVGGVAFAVETTTAGLGSWLQLLLCVVSAAGTYLLLALIVPAFRRDVAGIIALRHHLRR